MKRTASLLVGGVVLAMLPMSAATAAISAGPKPNHKVGVCHRTASDKHPYVFLIVDKDSAQYKAHLAHRNNPKEYKHGRRDYIDGLDGSIKSLADCPNGGKPVPPPPPPPPGPPGHHHHHHHHHHPKICRLTTPTAYC